MKKLYRLCFVLFLVLSVVIGFSQDALPYSEILPVQAVSDSRFNVVATVMDTDTWCRVSWPDPMTYYWELLYDDGSAEDLVLWQFPGNMNAVKFTPSGYPFIVTGGRINVGDGYFPGPFLGTSFRVLVYDDDGEDGLPGTVLDSMDVTVNNYGWVEFEGMTASITEGDFYLAMKQTAPAPDAAPVGVDTDNPTYYKSYSYIQGNPGWTLSVYQDFMIRAWIVFYNEPSRNIDYFQLARFSNFNPNGFPLLGDTTLLDTIIVSEYDDYAWDSLPAGLYAYGVKTHFTGGVWSDYDVSNVVTHIMNCYMPSCFYQADTGNRSLIMCPPLDSTGTVPDNFIGYNLYQDGDFVDFLPSSTTSYDPAPPLPVKAYCDLTAVYDLAPFGFPGETGESFQLTTEYIMRWGYPLPFLENWNLGNFDDNNWLTDGPNWSITGQMGNPSPCAEFTWDPVQTNYFISLESYPLLADSMTEGEIYLDFDIKLSSVFSTGTELLLVQVWNWDDGVWTTAKTYSNEEGSFDWVSVHLDISPLAMNTVFKIRFSAQGENSIDILNWFIDNIHVYRACNPPQHLIADFIGPIGIALNWDSPEGIPVDQWIHWDDGVNSGNSIGVPTSMDIDVAARWEPLQLAEFEGASVTQISFFPAEEQTIYRVRVWIGAGAANLVADQEVISPFIGQWNTVTLDTPVPIDISKELWIGYQFNAENGYPAGVDDGPAIDGYGNMMNFGGWQTLLEINPDLDYNWNIWAFIEMGPFPDSVANYNIYRSDDGSPYFLLDYSNQNYYLDVTACNPWGVFHEYKITAIYITGIDTCESGFSNEAADACEGISDNNDESFVIIYPNPSNDHLKIESSKELGLISLYNSYGELILKKKVDERRFEIPVSAYPAGVYMIRAETGKETVSRKVVVIH
jgi:hypothetical protein